MLRKINKDGSDSHYNGVVIPPFDYSDKKLISIKDYETKQHLEFRRIKSLSTKTQLWYIRRRDVNCYQNDVLSKLKGIGKETMAKFNSAGIMTLGDLCDMNDESLSKATLPLKTVKRLREFVRQTVKRENGLADIDYRHEENPYKE